MDQPNKTVSQVSDPVIKIVLGEKSNTLEIRFSNLPNFQARKDLRNNGFRSLMLGMCWYKRDSASTRAYAAKYGTVPGNEDRDPAAGMIQAQEDAYFDNWANQNN